MQQNVSLQGPNTIRRKQGHSLPKFIRVQATPIWSLWQRWWPTLMVVSLTVLAIVVRWWDLGAYKDLVNFDEANFMVDARRFLTGELTTPFIETTDFNPALYNFLLAQIWRVTGVSVTVAREYTSLWGALGIPLLYGLARELGLRRSTAAAAAALLVTASWHVHISRMVFVNINGATMVEAVLYCTVAAIRRYSLRWAALTGVVLALAMNGYIGTRVVFPILGVWLGCLVLLNSRLGQTMLARLSRRHVAAPPLAVSRMEMTSPQFQVSIQRLSVVAGTALVIAAILLIPLIQYYVLTPGEFIHRTAVTFAFDPTYMQWLGAVNPGLRHDVWGIAGYQFNKTFWMFTAVGPTDPAENLPGRPLLDAISGVFLPIGLLACLWTWRRPLSALTLSWVVLTFIFSAFLTVDAPNAHRSVPISPALCLVIALGLETTLSFLSWVWSLVSQAWTHLRQRRPIPRPRGGEQPGSMAGQVSVSRGRRTRTQDLISRALLCATVIVIGVVNIRREIDLDTSLVYGETMASPAIFWSHYLNHFGAIKAAVDSPLGWRPEFSRLFAPHADLCAARWLNQWQRCPDVPVVIFEPGAEADAARYAAATHLTLQPGPAPYGQRLYWYLKSRDRGPLPDVATVLHQHA